MVFGKIQGAEVEEIGLDFGTFRNRITHFAEDVFDFAAYQGDRMNGADMRVVAGKSPVYIRDRSRSLQFGPSCIEL
jgi:hypothetical protein